MNYNDIRCIKIQDPTDVHYAKIELVLIKKVMERSGYIVSDPDFIDKLKLYCMREKKNIKTINLDHIKNSISNNFFASKEAIDAVYDFMLMKGTMPQKEYLSKLYEITKKIK